MKKHLFLAAVVVVSLASCKKTYTCDCTTTLNYKSGSTTYSEFYKGSTSTYSEKMKEKQAKAACDHEAAAIQSDFIDGYTDHGNSPFSPGESISTSCSLK